MKRHILLLSLTLLCLASCNTDELSTTYGPLPKELLGRWAPESADNTCDRYIQFESGQCYTYFNPNSQYFIDGNIYLTESQFTLMNARYCHLSGDNPAHLVMDGKDAGTLLLFPETDPVSQKTEAVLVINQQRYRRVKNILQESSLSFDKVVLDADPFDPSIPDMKTLFLEPGESAHLTYKLYLEGTPTPLDEDEAAKYIDWISLNEKIATVDNKGNITTHKNGTVILKIRTYDVSCTDACQLIVGGGDLSKNGTANCYITNNPGHYRFVMAKGNGEKNVGAVAGVKILWETFNSPEAPEEGSIIREVRLSESKDSIYFKIPYPMKDGNALIAAVDAGNNILWSWHIWSCKDFDAVNTAQVYLNNAGTLMDRNLGALSAEPGQMGSAGLLYQWGRKDPFPGATQVAPARNILRAKTTHDDDWEYVVGIIPPEYAAKPMSFCRASNGYDWAESNLNFWNEEKTCYDPCPPGWKVANANVLTKALTDAVEYKSASLLEWPRLDGYWAFDLGRKVSTATHVYYPMTAGIFVPTADGTPFYYMTDFSRIWCNKRVDNASTAQSICLNFTDDQVPNKIGLYWNAPGGKLRDEDIHYCGKACGNAVRCMME